MVDTLNGEALGFLGLDPRRTRKRKGNGHYIQMTPKKKSSQSNQGQGTRHHSAQRGNPHAESGWRRSMPRLLGGSTTSGSDMRVAHSAKCATTRR